MGVGIAPNVAQQRLVIDVAALVNIEPGGFREPHRQHAGAQRKIPGLAGRQIRRIGQRHQKISASDRRYSHFAFSL
jgi:hypothetical protein